jgi:hypothetical protein
MSARDELARLIFERAVWTDPSAASDQAADAILAAGYRKPRTITTGTELEALPFLTLVRDTRGSVHERVEWEYGPALQWVCDGRYRHPELPVTVLYNPPKEN